MIECWPWLRRFLHGNQIRDSRQTPKRQVVNWDPPVQDGRSGCRNAADDSQMACQQRSSNSPRAIRCRQTARPPGGTGTPDEAPLAAPGAPILRGAFCRAGRFSLPVGRARCLRTRLAASGVGRPAIPDGTRLVGALPSPRMKDRHNGSAAAGVTRDEVLTKVGRTCG